MILRPITKMAMAECRRLRIEENLSTPAIARNVSICNQSVYRILKNYPWRTERKAPTRGKLWTVNDNATLRKLWPTAEQSEILAALPGRSWDAISKHAPLLKIRRRPPSSRRIPRSVHPILIKLRQIREEKNITRPQLMEMTGYHINQILNWENGKTRPMLHHVYDLAEALGVSLVLKVPTSLETIPFPDRKKLMAAR